MATIDIPILGAMTAPDDSGDAFFEPLETAMTLGTAAYGNLLCLTMAFPTGADVAVFGKFNVPQNYVGTPVLVIRGVLGGTPAAILAFGMDHTPLADSESVDAAFSDIDLVNNSTWTGYAIEEMYEETITLTPTAAYVAGDEVLFRFYRDESVDTTTFDFHLTGLLFRYNDA